MLQYVMLIYDGNLASGISISNGPIEALTNTAEMDEECLHAPAQLAAKLTALNVSIVNPLTL